MTYHYSTIADTNTNSFFQREGLSIKGTKCFGANTINEALWHLMQAREILKSIYISLYLVNHLINFTHLSCFSLIVGAIILRARLLTRYASALNKKLL